MEVSLRELREIGNSLPISYYCGRKIETKIVDNEPTSYYDPSIDTITLSLTPIQTALANLKDTVTEDKETLVRSVFYHELSHAMLTPRKMSVTDIKNIFEDERIERKCDDYYMGVNFKKSLIGINGFKSMEDVIAKAIPKTATQAFYLATRFGIAKPHILKAIADTLKKNDNINANSNNWDIHDYENDIARLYSDIAEEFNKSDNPQDYFDKALEELKQELGEKGKPLTDKELAEELEKANNHGMNVMENYDGTEYEKPDKDKDGQGESANGDGSEKDNSAEGKNGSGCDGETETEGDNGEDGDSENGNGNPAHGKGRNKGRNVFKDITNAGYGKNLNGLVEQFDSIIQQFNKRNNGGSSLNGYSGVINPRNIGREDMKYFTRRAAVQGNNMYGSLHLNLFIDVSGSFRNNQNVVNNILKALEIIEHKYNFFNFDLITCGTHEQLKDKKERQIYCYGGNKITPALKSIFTKVQKPSTMNYNIALFDGDCMSDIWSTSNRNEACKKYFHILDRNNVTLITEEGNLEYCKDFVHTKPIVENYNYSQKLVENIIKAMEKAFR